MADRTPPRLMTKAGLRAHLGSMPWKDVEMRMTTGRLPGPVWGLAPNDPRARWDRRAVDMALDQASQIPGSIEQEVAMLDRALGIL